MGKRGPPPQPPNVVRMRGTARSDRARDYVVGVIETEPTPPDWLAGDALAIFWRKVRTYAKRQQPIAGLEDTLAHYCQLEAEIIDKVSRRVEVTAAERNILIRFATQFYDTPAAQVGSPRKPSGDNPFGRNGQKPR